MQYGRRSVGRGRVAEFGVVLAALAIGAVVLGGMGSGPQPTAATAGSRSEAGPSMPRGIREPGAAPRPTSAGAPGPVAKGKARVTISFVGDVNFTGPLSSALAANPSAALSSIAPALGDADLTVANLESAVTERGTPAPKTYTFRAPPTALVALRSSGVDVVSIANNHGLDYGEVGVPDALAASRSSGLPVIGIGDDEAHAMAPFRATVRGHRVAVIGATQVLDDNLISAWTATPDHAGLASAKRVDELVGAVKATRPTTDTLVVVLHWGVEQHTCPSADQRQLARKLVDAGADIVVGSHAHRVEGAGRMGNAVVDYGLGNFAFDAPSPASATTGILTVQVGGGQPPAYRWRPGRIAADNVPTLLSGQAKDAALHAWTDLRGCTGLAP